MSWDPPSDTDVICEHLVDIRKRIESLEVDRRERIATAVLQGLLASSGIPPVNMAIGIADALIAALDASVLPPTQDKP